MTSPIGAVEVERLRRILARRMGLAFEDGKIGFLGDVLRRRLAATGSGCDAYLARIEAGDARDELPFLAQEITVGETYFFRHIDQFRAFAEIALPQRMRAQGSRRRLRILSAGCASGEEAYSLAIAARDVVLDGSWVVSIQGVDANPAMIEKAARGRFSVWSLREMPADVERRWFRAEGRDVALDDAIRASATFEVRNLVEDDPDLWQPGAYDVIFCRNVMMYFTPEAARGVMTRIARALAPGGYLFLGHAETLRGLSHDFHLRHTHGAFYYQRKDAAEQSHPLPDAARSTTAPAPFTVGESDGSWIDAIRRASERIQALTDAPQGGAGPGARPHAAHARDLARPLDLLGRERFADALQALPADGGDDPDALLLRAVLLTHNGDLGAAEEVCQRLLLVDELSSGAHYVLALCREAAGDRRAAADHDQVAAYLDPGFAMPHLHLGLLARRAGDHEGARRELGQALALLQLEDAPRLLLFGGGFSRDALGALCRAELVAVGGAP